MQVTERQKEIYEYIVAFRRENGCSPSIPEIQRHFGILSPNGVAGHLKALEAKGLIKRAERGSRQIDIPAEARVTPMPDNVYELPVYGSIAAGYPQMAQGSTESTTYIDQSMLGFKPKEGCFVLKVRGDSMKDAGILNGDYVVVEPTPSPAAGQIVAALIDGESTLKRLVTIKGTWFLKAENAAYPELHPRADLVVQGTVRTVIRKLG